MARRVDIETLRGVRIIAARRLAQDPSGNPRWFVVLSDGTQAETAPGAPCAYQIGDTAMHGVPLTVVLHDGQLWTARK